MNIGPQWVKSNCTFYHNISLNYQPSLINLKLHLDAVWKTSHFFYNFNMMHQSQLQELKKCYEKCMSFEALVLATIKSSMESETFHMKCIRGTVQKKSILLHTSKIFFCFHHNSQQSLVSMALLQ
jgi:hypothetical protein